MKRILIILAAAALLAGCSKVSLYSQLSEQQANEMLALLMRADVHADKVFADKSWSIATSKGDLPRAIDYLEEAMLIARQIDNPDALCNACYLLAGILVEEGQEIARALSLYEECLRVARKHQRAIVESMTLGELARVAFLYVGHPGIHV